MHSPVLYDLDSSVNWLLTAHAL